MSRVHNILRLCHAAGAFSLNSSHRMLCVPPPPLSFIGHVYENPRRKAKGVFVLPKLAHATLVSESSRHDEKPLIHLKSSKRLLELPIHPEEIHP